MLRPHEEEGCVVLDAVVRSWAPVNPFVIRWDFPVWKPAPELDPTQLRQESRRRPRQAQGEPADVKAAEPWTPIRFARTFVTDRPQTKEQLLARASLQDLSQRKATQLLLLAEQDGQVHRWAQHRRTDPVRFATVPQPLIEEPHGN